MLCALQGEVSVAIHQGGRGVRCTQAFPNECFSPLDVAVLFSFALRSAGNQLAQSDDALKLSRQSFGLVSPRSDLCMFIDKFRGVLSLEDD